MIEHRVKGEIGDGLTVMTEWLDIPKGEAAGVEIGLKTQRKWRNTQIETRES